MQQRPMIELSLAGDQHACDIDQIHRGTAVYTALPEIEALLDLLEWPAHGKRLLDPGAGNGGFVVAALARIPMAANDVETAVHRVRGYEFHPGAAKTARAAVTNHLIARGWNGGIASSATALINKTTDFPLSPVPSSTPNFAAAHPPQRLAPPQPPPDT